MNFYRSLTRYSKRKKYTKQSIHFWNVELNKPLLHFRIRQKSMVVFRLPSCPLHANLNRQQGQIYCKLTGSTRSMTKIWMVLVRLWIEKLVIKFAANCTIRSMKKIFESLFSFGIYLIVRLLQEIHE